MSETVEPALSGTAQLSLSNPDAKRLRDLRRHEIEKALWAFRRDVLIDGRGDAMALKIYELFERMDREAFNRGLRVCTKMLPPTPTETPEQ